jgi:putative glutamine amidotransferase
VTGDRAPTIGITCGRMAPDQKERPPFLGQNQTYVQAVIRAGAAPLLIPVLSDSSLLRTLYASLDGLLLPGGKDVASVYFGEALHEKSDPVAPERDEMELRLTRWAVDEGKPLLGICRGMQVLNVALGGGLYQDIEAQIPDAEKHTWYPNHPRDHLSHTVLVTPEARLARTLGAAALPVNSGHHQAIRDVAPGLTVVARAPDGVVEGLEAGGHPFALGVQWHPEELAAGDPRQQRIFDALVDACRR